MTDRDEPTAGAAQPEQGPEPGDPRKPESPGELTSPSRRFILGSTARKFRDDQCTDIAAALTYYAVLSLFPGLIALVSLLGLVGQSGETTSALLDVLRRVGAGTVVDTIEPVVQELTASPAAGVALVLGLLGALWSASAYVTAFGRAMNRVYEVGEGRPVWKLRPVMLLVTTGVLALVALTAVALVVSGPVAEAVGGALGLSDVAVTVWGVAKWPVLLAVVVLVVATLYHWTPNVRQPRLRWVSIGATVAILTWVLASAAFGFYVANFGSYNATYGSLGGVIVFLLWLWITNLALIFGAELDAETERGRELQAGIAAEENIQLPPRDTTKIEKDAKKTAARVARARRLRERTGKGS